MTDLAQHAVNLHVQLQQKRRAGDPTDTFLIDTVLPATNAAVDAGADYDAIHAAADRTYGQWLIDNAGK